MVIVPGLLVAGQWSQINLSLTPFSLPFLLHTLCTLQWKEFSEKDRNSRFCASAGARKPSQTQPRTSRLCWFTKVLTHAALIIADRHFSIFLKLPARALLFLPLATAALRDQRRSTVAAEGLFYRCGCVRFGSGGWLVTDLIHHPRSMLFYDQVAPETLCYVHIYALLINTFVIATFRCQRLGSLCLFISLKTVKLWIVIIVGWLLFYLVIHLLPIVLFPCGSSSVLE